ASVLPSSTTSGTVLPPSAASSCCKWFGQAVQLTVTSAPVAALKRAIASSRTGFHFGFWASAMIHAVMVLAWPFRSPVSLGPAGVLLLSLLHATAPSSVAASAAATAILRFTRSLLEVALE